jgi:15-cis-phytoene synthase
MPQLEVRQEDLEHCHRLLAAGSKSFSAASKLLPRGVRERATVLYAFCRVTDDRVDDAPDASIATVDGLRERLRLAYAGRPVDDPVDRALAGILAETRIPHALPGALLEGMEWDAVGRRYETLDDLYAYAARVAGTVGAMMTLLMGERAPAVLARACDLGVAMQLTNVARDVGEDARRGRIYLPEAWLREEGLDPQAWLAKPEPNEAVARVVRRVLEAADVLYARADRGVTMLPPSCRTAIKAARLVYSDIGRYVARSGYDSVTSRAYVPAWRKLWLVLRSLGARFQTSAPLLDPPLGATRMLVSACETQS